jgi:hypothetical protein
MVRRFPIQRGGPWRRFWRDRFGQVFRLFGQFRTGLLTPFAGATIIMTIYLLQTRVPPVLIAWLGLLAIARRGIRALSLPQLEMPTAAASRICTSTHNCLEHLSRLIPVHQSRCGSMANILFAVIALLCVEVIVGGNYDFEEVLELLCVRGVMFGYRTKRSNGSLCRNMKLRNAV